VPLKTKVSIQKANMKNKNYYHQNRNLNVFKGNLSLINKYVISFNNNNFHDHIAKKLLSKVLVLCKHRGSIAAISWVKDLRIAVYAAIGDYKVVIPFIPRYKNGVPKVFGPEVASLIKQGDLKAIKYVLTLLQVSRYLDGQKAADFSPITEESNYTNEIRKEFKSRVGKALANLRLAPKAIPQWEKPHFTSKGSPSGPAILSIKNDLSNLTDNLIKDIGVIAGPLIVDYINDLKSNPDVILVTQEPKPERKNRLRSHGLVEDTEAKTRIVAMADYWTQSSLKPLHEDLLFMLRKIKKTDLTFGQDIKPFGMEGETYYSFDLTSATDRLPRFLYTDVLEDLYGKDFSNSWERIMVDYDFIGPDGTARKYGTGQPMGLYSSWPLLALVHHTIVQVAAQRSGFRRFEEYRILGDDIVIRHSEVAIQYQQILSQLGVGISKTKTLISNETFEFAKRLFHKGVEVTAFPIHGISSSIISGWQDLYSVLETASKRNFGSLELLIKPRLIKSFYRANALPLYLATLSEEEREARGKINPQTILNSQLKATRMGRVASAYIDTFYITSTLDHTSPVFLRVCDFWRMLVTCTTDTRSALREVVFRYTMELDSELTRTYAKSLEDTAKVLGVDKEMLMPKLLFGPPAYVGPDLLEPLSWIIVDQAKRMQEVVMNPPNVSDEEENLELWYSSLKDLDLRILDPKILDRSRRFQRDIRIKQSCSIKALASIKKEMLILLPGILRSDKFRRKGIKD
jgi:hypothetical protein